MKVEYTLTPEDYIASVPESARSASGNSWLSWTLGLVTVWLFIMLNGLVLVARGVPWPPVVVGGFLLAGTFFAFAPSLRRLVTRRLIEAGARRGQIPGGPMSLEIRPEGLVATTGTTATLTTWNGIFRIVVGDNYAFFYRNELAVYILPRRAFAQPDTFDEFVERARGYHEAARTSP